MTKVIIVGSGPWEYVLEGVWPRHRWGYLAVAGMIQVIVMACLSQQVGGPFGHGLKELEFRA